MDRNTIISNLKNYFLGYLNDINNENEKRLNFSINYLSNQIEFASTDIQFRIVINKSFNNSFSYRIINDKLNEVISYSKDYREKSNHDVIKSFYHVFISINGDNNFKFLLKKCLDEYNVFLISELANKISVGKKNLSVSWIWGLPRNPKPVFYVITTLNIESYDTGKVGGDSRSTTNTRVSFHLVPIAENLSEKEKKLLEELQNQLDKKSVFNSETSHYFGPAGEPYGNTVEFLDVNLSRYIKHNSLFGVKIYNLPTGDYEREFERNNLIKEMKNDIKTLHLLVFSLFFNVNDLKNTDFDFFGLIDYLIEPKDGGNILGKISSSNTLSLIYDNNKSLIESCLYSQFSEDDIVSSINDYYINCSSQNDLFALNALYFAFKKYYE